MACLYVLLGQLLEEAGLIASVTYWSRWLAHNQDGIAITVLPHREHLDAVA